MRLREELSTAQIAERVGLPEPDVVRLLARTYRQMRRDLAQEP